MKNARLKIILLASLLFIILAASPLYAAYKFKSESPQEGGQQKLIEYVTIYGGIFGYSTNVDSLEVKIAKIIGAALAFVGVIFLILIIYGGVLWMTAGGNEEQVKKARKYIINATIGLAIVIMSYLIVGFIISTLAQTAVTTSEQMGERDVNPESWTNY